MRLLGVDLSDPGLDRLLPWLAWRRDVLDQRSWVEAHLPGHPDSLSREPASLLGFSPKRVLGCVPHMDAQTRSRSGGLRATFLDQGRGPGPTGERLPVAE